MFTKVIILFLSLLLIVSCSNNQLARNKICNNTKINYTGFDSENIQYSSKFIFFPSYSEPNAEYLITIFDEKLKEKIDACNYLNWVQPEFDSNDKVLYQNLYDNLNAGRSINEELIKLRKIYKAKYIVLNYIKKYDSQVAGSYAYALPFVNMVGSETYFRNGFLTNLVIIDLESGVMSCDLHLEAFSDESKSRFNYDDSLFIDKAISNLICELYYFPKYKNDFQLKNSKSLMKEKLVLSEIVDEFLKEISPNNHNFKTRIYHKIDLSLSYFLADDDMERIFDHFLELGIIKYYRYDNNNTNLPGFSVDLNVAFFK